MRSRTATAAIALALGLALASSASATYPGRDGRIAFVARVGCDSYSGPGDACAEESYGAIVTIAPSGGAARPLARCPGPHCVPAIVLRAVWSPDGSLLAVNVFDGAEGVAILTAAGALVRRLRVPGYVLSWLPDGRRLAVLSGGEVLTVAAAGGPTRAVTGPHGPRAWSARGDVAIAHRRGIMVWRASSGRRRLVLAARGRFRFGIPDWSPDGRRLAVARTDLRTGLSTIVDVSASGGRARVIVRACLVGDPVWSPAGSRLAFASTCLDEPSGDDAPSVYAVRPDGSRLRRLFDPTDLSPPGAPFDRYVSPALSWQPLP